MNKEEIWLHLGCGGIKLSGYINVDILDTSAADEIHDISSLPYEKNTIDKIYSCANIEHFSRKKWKEVLSHWYGLLKDGGLLRLSTADFEAVCEEYMENREIEKLLGLVVGGQKDEYDFHGMVFDFQLLKTVLKEIGFKNIRRYDWRETDIGYSGIDDYSQSYLPHMDKESGRLMMLNVEATK